MKRATAFIMACILAVGILSGCSSNPGANVTRGEWISLLASRFGLDDYQNQDPYFSDVQSDDEIFGCVQSCKEWNVLKEEREEFSKNENATLGFVIATAVYATGADLTPYSGTDDEKARQYAIENGIVSSSLNVSKRATTELCGQILDAAQTLYLDRQTKPVEKIVYDAKVQDLRTNGTAIQKKKNNEYTVSGFKPVVGDIYIAPGDSENPEGIAIKVVKVSAKKNGTYTITTEQPEIHEVFDEIEYAGVAIPKYEDILPAKGVEISKDLSVEAAEPTAADPAVTTVISSAASVSDPRAALLGIGTSKNDALSFKAKCNFTKGTVSVAPEWKKQSLEIEQLTTGIGSASPNEGSDDPYNETLAPGELFKKTSVFPGKDWFGPDKYNNEKAIRDYKNGKISIDELKKTFEKQQNKDQTEKVPNVTNKFTAGYEIIGEIAVSDLYVVPTYHLKTYKLFGFIDTGIPTGIESFSIETNYSVTASLSVKGKIEDELTICSIPVPLGSIATLKLELILYAELNGELAIKAQIKNNTKTEYANGVTKKTSSQQSSASVEAGITFEAGPGLKAKLTILSIPIVDVKLTAALQIKGNGSLSLTTEWSETDDAYAIDRKTAFHYSVDGYVPIVKLKIGTDKSTLANKLNLQYTWTVIDSDRAYHFAVIPPTEVVLWQDHQEFPKVVPETQEATESKDTKKISFDENILTLFLKKLGEFLYKFFSAFFRESQTNTVTGLQIKNGFREYVFRPTVSGAAARSPFPRAR